MKHLSTAFLTLVLVIAVYQGGGVTAQDDHVVDQVADEAKNHAVTIIDGPKYVAQQKPGPQSTTTQPEVQTPKAQERPPSKPPLVPDKPVKQTYVMNRSPFYGQTQKIPPPRLYHKLPFKLHNSLNSVYKFPGVIPLPPQHKHHLNHIYIKQSRPLLYAASTNKPATVITPKFSLPTQTINGIRADFVRPPKYNTTTTTTTATTTTKTTTTTTTRAPRTKRIWPKRILEKMNSTIHNTTVTKDNKTISNTINTDDQDTSASHQRTRVVSRQRTTTTTTAPTPTTKRSYRPVTRKSKIPSSTLPTPINFTDFQTNEWVPIVPSHFPKINKKTINLTPISRRSDVFPSESSPIPGKQMLYLQSFGLVPVPTQIAATTPIMARKKMVFLHHNRQLNPSYSGYSMKPAHSPISYVSPHDTAELHAEGSHVRPHVVTKIKHHHHHHHHRYIKTVEKKVPYKVEVPKPYPVEVEKKVPVPVEKLKVVEKPVPYPVTVEKKVPYPIGIKVPQPVPVKVVQKEYVPKPYPIIHHVPVVKEVQVKVPQPVPYPVEKRVPYPVPVKVPVQVDRPVSVPVPVEKRVPYPVPVKVFVPQPYPVETKVPYPVEVIKHVPVKVPVPQPYPVKVSHPVPVPVEKKVPYPVEVEKKVPVPYKVFVPQRVEVEKKVYVPQPYPVEKRVPYPVKVPYKVNVPVKVPVEVPVFIQSGVLYDDLATAYTGELNTAAVTEQSPYTVTVHGNGSFDGFQSRADNTDPSTTTSSPSS